jgi:predicted DNA-binding transcriptional regulator YafY
LATNKHAIIRYQALDKCFRNIGKRYFMDDLIEACNQVIYEFTGSSDGVKKRQIFEDIKFMESAAGYSIDLLRLKDGKKVYYRYLDPNFSINSQPLNEAEANQLKEALFTLGRFKGLPQFNWIGELTTRLESSFSLIPNKKEVIHFEQNEYLKGLDFISPLYHAITYQKVLKIKYQGFKQSEAVNYVFHPQLLKQYNNRWFLIGMIDENEQITNLSLDRIINIEESNNIKYKESYADFTDLFEDVIGVSIPKEANPQKVQIKINEQLAPYIFSKPIHGSQRVIDRDNLIIEIDVFINYELMSVIMSYGDGLEILRPIEFRIQLKEKFKNILSKYD